MQQSLLTSADDVREAASSLDDVGAEQVFFWPAVDDLGQVDRIAAALGLPS